MQKNIRVLMILAVATWALPGGSFTGLAHSQTSESSASSIAKRIGTVKAVAGNTLTLSPTGGPDVVVTVQPNARVLRLAPGERDLKSATPIQVQGVQPGDTVRVRGTASQDGKTFDALEVIVITRAAVAAVSDQIRQDWQKRGVGGRVESVDAASGSVNLSIPSLTAKKTLVVHTTPSTVVYRYAADSPKPEDAKRSTLQDIQPGDQLRARGNKNPDGTEINAEEIFAGNFPQFAATVKSVDASAGILTVQDLATKKTQQIKVTSDSQVLKIPAEMAQMFAMRLKSQLPAGMPGAGRGEQARPETPAPTAQSAAPGGTAAANGGTAGDGHRNGAPDLQRVLSRLPSSTLADLNLQKGDAVIILATEGNGNDHTAITLLSGVEPILQAAPSAGQAMMLTPWSLGGGAPGGDASQ